MIFMKKGYSLAVVITLLVILTTNASGKKEISPQPPDPGNIQIIKTFSGSTFIGRIVDVSADVVSFETHPDVGTLSIPITDISSIEEFPETSLRDGKYWFPNPNATRLFFSPTGRMQQQGHGYFADYYIVVPMVAYGVTDWFGIGGGVSLVPFIKIYEQAFYLMPRVGFIQRENIAWCGGLLFGKLPTFDFEEEAELFSAGLAYSTATYGTLDLSVTGGIGYGLLLESVRDSASDEWSSELSTMDWPIFMIGGEWRCGRRISLVTENWIIPDFPDGIPALPSYGARLFGEQISVDFGFVVPLVAIDAEIPMFPGIPYLDFVYNF